ncbi:hypothetical protein JTB14_027818 [Gonioctena quinquepunctata]|nr:hypothetical protein JTB14_027818 [Gonioctena quinquepunctata]
MSRRHLEVRLENLHSRIGDSIVGPREQESLPQNVRGLRKVRKRWNSIQRLLLREFDKESHRIMYCPAPDTKYPGKGRDTKIYRPFIMVTIGESGFYAFLDTGATRSFASEAVRNCRIRLGLEPIRQSVDEYRQSDGTLCTVSQTFLP